MKAQLEFQNQWGPHYGKAFSVFGLSVWWFGFQILILNFRIYFRIHKGDNYDY